MNSRCVNSNFKYYSKMHTFRWKLKANSSHFLDKSCHFFKGTWWALAIHIWMVMLGNIYTFGFSRVGENSIGKTSVLQIYSTVCQYICMSVSTVSISLSIFPNPGFFIAIHVVCGSVRDLSPPSSMKEMDWNVKLLLAATSVSNRKNHDFHCFSSRCPGLLLVIHLPLLLNLSIPYVINRAFLLPSMIPWRCRNGYASARIYSVVPRCCSGLE